MFHEVKIVFQLVFRLTRVVSFADFLITCHIYETCKTFAPGDLTDLRSALVNNNTFAALAVKYGMHKLCVYNSADLFSKIDTFVNFQEEHNHEVTDDVSIILNEIISIYINLHK